MKLLSPPGAPRWVLPLLTAIERAIADPRDVPLRLQEYATPADLPDATSWRAGLVFVKSIDRIAVSNGTNWLRADTGATL